MPVPAPSPPQERAQPRVEKGQPRRERVVDPVERSAQAQARLGKEVGDARLERPAQCGSALLRNVFAGRDSLTREGDGAKQAIFGGRGIVPEQRAGQGHSDVDRVPGAGCTRLVEQGYALGRGKAGEERVEIGDPLQPEPGVGATVNREIGQVGGVREGGDGVCAEEGDGSRRAGCVERGKQARMVADAPVKLDRRAARMVEFTSTSIPVLTALRKPGSSTSTRYVPG